MKLKKSGLIMLIVQYAIAVILIVALVVGSCVAFFFEPEINTVLAPPHCKHRKLGCHQCGGTKDVCTHYGRRYGYAQKRK